MLLTKKSIKSDWHGTASTGHHHWVRVYRTRMTLGLERCRLCGHTGTRRNPLTLDHIRPLSDSGSNHINNATVLCRSDNRAKDTKRLPLLSLAAEEARAPAEQRWSTLPLPLDDAAAALWREWAREGQCPSCVQLVRVTNAWDMAWTADTSNARARWLCKWEHAALILDALGACRCASARVSPRDRRRLPQYPTPSPEASAYLPRDTVRLA